LLVPWPNRVEGGRYRLAGTSYQLDLSEPGLGTAIHGLTRWQPWSVIRSEPGEVALRHVLLGRSGYPFCLEAEARYQVSDQGLRVSVSARNVGSRPAPYGTGSHPYLTTGTPLVDDCELTLPAARWQPADDRGIPAGPPQDVGGTRYDFRAARKLGDARLDHAFTGLDRGPDGRAWVRLAGPERGVRLWADEGYRWLQAFTGDPLDEPQRRRALAVEPMTCPPNAFVTGADLLVLEPDDTVRHEWGIEALAG
jgi:aldose 1-epimerase